MILPRELMENEPELKELIDQPVAIRWMGPDAHIVAYPIKAHQAFNIVTTHITNRHDLSEDWTAQADKRQMQERFANYVRPRAPSANTSAPPPQADPPRLCCRPRS